MKKLTSYPHYVREIFLTILVGICLEGVVIYCFGAAHLLSKILILTIMLQTLVLIVYVFYLVMSMLPGRQSVKEYTFKHKVPMLHVDNTALQIAYLFYIYLKSRHFSMTHAAFEAIADSEMLRKKYGDDALATFYFELTTLLYNDYGLDAVLCADELWVSRRTINSLYPLRIILSDADINPALSNVGAGFMRKLVNLSRSPKQ
jgi:hypothetical protein